MKIRAIMGLSLGLGLGLAPLSGCFEGKFLAGRACTSDSDCGPSLSCEAGVCGGYACPVDLVDGVCPCQGPATHACTQLTRPSTKVDILLVIDDTGSASQATLSQLSMPLAATLDTNLADYRIAFTTTDNGNPWCDPAVKTPESGEFVLSSCRDRLDEFVFGPTDQTQLCLDACVHDSITTIPTAAAGQAEVSARPWLEGTPSNTNLTDQQPFEEVLPCLLMQGVNGCGFGQPLESLWLALEGSTDVSSPNYGFVREDAHLLVVIVTDESDCSYNPDWSEIFDPDGGREFWSDPTAMSPTKAVCWNAGVTCTGGPTPYDDCVPTNLAIDGQPSADPSVAVMQPIDRYVDKLEQIAAAKRATDGALQVSATLIAGVPEGYDGTMVYSSDPELDNLFGVGFGCAAIDPPPAALPPPRMLGVLDQLSGAHNRAYSICSDEFDGAFDGITETIEDALPAQCMQACVADKLAAAGLQPDCSLSYPSEGGSIEIPFCQLDELSRPILADDPLCYYTRGGASVAEACRAEGSNLQFGFLTAAGVRIPDNLFAACEPSTQPEIDCPTG